MYVPFLAMVATAWHAGEAWLVSLSARRVFLVLGWREGGFTFRDHVRRTISTVELRIPAHAWPAEASQSCSTGLMLKMDFKCQNVILVVSSVFVILEIRVDCQALHRSLCHPWTSWKLDCVWSTYE